MKNCPKIVRAAMVLAAVFAVPFSAFAAMPVVTTNPASGVTSTEARLNGYITSDSNRGPLSVWAELGKSPNSLDFSSTPLRRRANEIVQFSKNLIEMEPNTVYYFRIVAQNPDGKTYGSILSFKTGTGGGAGISYSTPVDSGSVSINDINGAQIPSATTMFATNITHNSITFNGYVSPRGSNTYRWFEWGTTQLLGNRSGYFFAGTQPNNFAFTATGLNPGTTYYFRAVAQNNAGTVQGSMFSATTLAANQSPVGTSSVVIAPLVSAKLPTGIASTQATLNAFAVPGSASLVSGYFEWGNGAQALSNGTQQQQLQTNGVASFTHTLNGLLPVTAYYYRAVVQDANLIVYRSNIVSFNTTANAVTLSPAPTKTPGGNSDKQITPPIPEQTEKTEQKEPEEQSEPQNGRGAAGTIFFGTPSAGFIGWLLAIIFLVVSAILSVLLMRCRKQQPVAVNGANGFREFPE